MDDFGILPKSANLLAQAEILLIYYISIKIHLPRNHHCWLTMEVALTVCYFTQIFLDLPRISTFSFTSKTDSIGGLSFF